MKILVAIDDSQFSRNALKRALKVLNLQEATFLLLAVEEPTAMPSTSSIPGIFEDSPMLEMASQAEMVQLEEQRITSVLDWAEQVCQEAGVQTISRTEFGEAKYIIGRIAQEENCDLIVVGSHGYGRVERALLGSVSDYVVHRAQCPVMVVRDGSSEREQD
jgi:nucleotide-binding universal stress UspA family protein